MATDLRTRSRDYYMTRFSGGDKGPCVQVSMDSARPDVVSGGYVSLTREQAKKLSRDLAQFARGLEEEDRFCF